MARVAAAFPGPLPANQPGKCGTITESRARHCDQGGGREPQILYTREISGKSRDGEAEFKSRHGGTEQAAQAMVAACPPSFVLDVHVDPRDPPDSLMPGP